MGAFDTLSGYRFQALPNLSGCRDPTYSVLSAVRSIKFGPDEQAMARHFGVDLQALVRAAFARVLLGYIDSPEFLFAEVSPNREDQYSLARANLSEHKTWVAFAQQLEQRVRSNADFTVEAVRATLDLPRDVNPLPARFFCAPIEEFQSSCSAGVLLLGLPRSDTLVSSSSENLDAELFVVCDGTILSQPALEIYLEQVCATLVHVFTSPEASPTSVIPLPQELKSAYEETYNPSRAHVSVEWLMRNAASRPNAVAHEIYATLDEPAVVLTFAELNSRSNRLANWFLQHGVQLEDKVAVCRTRDEHFYVANAALFKSGACYVSIDPELPLERRQFIVRDSGAKFVVTTPQLAPDFGEVALVLEDKALEEEVSRLSSENVCLAQLDSLAYLLYTSGTTGTPKGCLLNHRGLYWAIEAMCTYPRPVTQPDTDKRLALASIAFDVHISEICQAWCLGIRLVSAPRYEILADLQGNLINLGITHAGMVPSMIEATLTGPDDLPLKYLVSGGEKISDSLLRKWANHPSLILANFYGPTEATIGCTSRLIKQTDRKENIGHPFPSCRAYVVDAAMNIVPRGNPGELVVEGPLVGRGYHNLPDVTAKAFKQWPGERCNAYCTGDLVRMMPDDTIEIMGRIDTQIKLRGVRIESEGVSNVLRKASEQPLDVATLIAKHPDSGSEMLVSFIALGDRQTPVAERRLGRVELARGFPPLIMRSLKRAAARELAVYMRPSHIVPVVFLPLSLNMKTDVKLLAEFFRATPVSTLLVVQNEQRNSEQSTSVFSKRDLDTTELSVAKVVSRLSGTSLDAISAESNLFECGMDSIKLSALARELRILWPGSQITVTDVLTAPVLSAIASLRHSSTTPELAANRSACNSFDQKWRKVAEGIFNPEDIEAVLPTFPVQDGVLFQALVSPSQYIQHFVYRIKQGVTNDDIREAWSNVMRQHPILRTAFVVEDTPLQVILRSEAIPPPLAIHHHNSSVDRNNFVAWFQSSEKARIATEINEDLSTPAFRISLYDYDEDKIMVVSLSHAIYDGVAVPNLMADVDAALSGEDFQDSIQLQPILNAIDVCQRSAQEFWVQKFSKFDMKSLPTRRSAGSRSQHARQVLTTLSYEAIQSTCRSQHSTLQALGCASFALSGCHYFGWQRDAVFGLIRSGRSLPVEGVETAVVPLVSLVPFVLTVGDRSTSDLLQDSQTELVSTSAFEHTTLGHIQRWLGVQSLFDVVFSCRVEEEREPYKSFEYYRTETPSPEFALAVEMLASPTSNTIELRVAFKESISATDINNLMSRIEFHLSAFCNGEFGAPLGTPPKNISASPIPTNVNGDGYQANHVDPDLEATLTSAVASFLNVDKSVIKATSSLVGLGLTSLKSVALSRKLKDSDIMISAIDIIQADTIRGMASRCRQNLDSSNSTDEGRQWLDDFHHALRSELAVDELRITSKDEPKITGATALQSGMLSQTVGSSDRLYVHGFTFKLRPNCSIEKLKSAWHRTIQESSILRTSFAFAAELGRWAQVVHSQFDIPWSSRSFSDPSAALTEFISTLSFQDIEDFARPPLHFCHFDYDGDSYILVILHHALYDGISLPLLFDRVRSIYHDMDVQPPASFHDLTPEILIQEQFGLPYWTKRLKGVNTYMFPRIINAPGRAWRSSAMCEVGLDYVTRICRRYQVNVQCIGQAAMAKLLYGVSKQHDIVFGQVISGRTLPNAENVIGPVFNTIPCRVDLSAFHNYGELLRGIQRSNNEGLLYQHASLRSIQRELGVKSLIDALFLFQPDTSISNANIAPIWDHLKHSNKDETKTQYGLNIELHQSSSGFAIRASCSASIMDQATLSDLLARFSDELRQIVIYPTSSVLGSSSPTSAPTDPEGTATHQPTSQAKEPTTIRSRFDGWSSTQLRFKDILIAFTKVPEQNVEPSSQLAALGLDSISAIQLAGMAKRAGIHLSAADVAGSTTLADIAAIVAKHPESSKTQVLYRQSPACSLLPERIIREARLGLPPSLRAAVEDILPTTPGMDFMISSWKRSGGWRFQHAFAFKVSPDTDAPRLHRAWDTLVERHAVLRSIFANVDGRNVLCVLKPGSIQIPWIDVVVDGEKSDLQEVGRLARSSVCDPHLLRGGPASGVTYLHGKESDYLILAMHHALYDAWSFNVLLRDLQDLYLDRPLDSTNDLSYLVRAIASPDNQEKQREYWQSSFLGFQPSIVETATRAIAISRPSISIGRQLQRRAQIPLLVIFGVLQLLSIVRHQMSRRTRNLLAGALATINACLAAVALVPPFRLLHSPRSAVHSEPSTPRDSTRMHSISRDLVPGFSALQAKAKERNLPLHMVLLACWAKVQAKGSGAGHQDAVFGLVHSGRGLEGVEDIGAPCINILPVYVRNALRDNAFVIAEDLQADLKLRSAVAEQSRLQDVSAWIGAPRKPLFHYFINMLRVPSSIPGGKPTAGVLERIKIPPDANSASKSGQVGFQVSSSSPFPVIEEVEDDCMIEVFFDGKKDSIGMEVTCQRHIMSESRARALAEAWAEEVKDTFRSL